jgi:hypothetical protein
MSEFQFRNDPWPIVYEPENTPEEFDRLMARLGIEKPADYVPTPPPEERPPAELEWECTREFASCLGYLCLDEAVADSPTDETTYRRAYNTFEAAALTLAERYRYRRDMNPFEQAVSKAVIASYVVLGLEGGPEACWYEDDSVLDGFDIAPHDMLEMLRDSYAKAYYALDHAEGQSYEVFRTVIGQECPTIYSFAGLMNGADGVSPMDELLRPLYVALRQEWSAVGLPAIVPISTILTEEYPET